MLLLPGFFGKLAWLLELKVCVTTAWSVRLINVAVLLSELQASLISESTNEISLQHSFYLFLPRFFLSLSLVCIRMSHLQLVTYNHLFTVFSLSPSSPSLYYLPKK